MAGIGVVWIFARRRLVLPESVLHITRHVLERTYGHIRLGRYNSWMLYYVWGTCVDVLEGHHLLIISKIVSSILKWNLVWKWLLMVVLNIALNYIFHILRIRFWVLDNKAVVLFLRIGKSPWLETHSVVLCLICRCRLFNSCMTCISLTLTFLRIFEAISTESVHVLPLPCCLSAGLNSIYLCTNQLCILFLNWRSSSAFEAFLWAVDPILTVREGRLNILCISWWSSCPSLAIWTWDIFLLLRGLRFSGPLNPSKLIELPPCPES